MSANLTPMLNLSENWAHMSASHTAATMLANQGPSQSASQYHPAMFNLSPTGGSCAMSQYIRNTYLPTSQHDTMTSLPVTTSPDSLLTHAQTFHDTHVTLDASLHQSAAVAAQAVRDRSAMATWSTLTPPNL